MNVKLKILKQQYQADNYNIFTFFPIDTTLPVHPKFKSVSLKGGNLSFLSVDKIYTLDIEPIDDYTYQLVSMPQVDVSNLTYDESLSILKECTSEKLANEMLTKYPNIISLIVSNKTDSIDVNNLKGIKKKLLSKISKNIKGKYSYCMIQQQFKKYKLTFSEAKTLSDKYGDMQSINQHINQNPYGIMIDDLDRSFERIDKIILSLNPELKDSYMRCEYATIYLLKHNELNGSTYSMTNDIAKSLYEIDNDLISKIKQVCISSDKIYYDSDKNRLAIMSTYLAEKSVAEFIKNKCAQNNVLSIDAKKYQKNDTFSLTEKQLGALYNLCKYTFNLLLGYAGAGKSSTLKSMIALCEDNNLTYKIVSFTGKAAQRCSEITHRSASTIHRLVLSEMSISSDVLFVDETSMIDLFTFKMLIDAIDNPNCHIVLIGDNAQLLPVGCGNIFNDIIYSNIVPITFLDEVFRYNDDGLIYVATNSRKGEQYLNGAASQKIGENFEFIQSNNYFQSAIDKYINLCNNGISPKDIMCLSPYNVGDFGTYRLNEAIQDLINPLRTDMKELKYKRQGYTIRFRVGDKVINKKNDYHVPVFEADEDKEVAIFNGQDGKILSITNDNNLIIQFENDVVEWGNDKIKNLLLGYVQSAHSAQGSQADYVINLCIPDHERMLNKNILYVALTRSIKYNTQIGSISAVNYALSQDGNKDRNTQLKEMLC